MNAISHLPAPGKAHDQKDSRKNTQCDIHRLGNSADIQFPAHERALFAAGKVGEEKRPRAVGIPRERTETYPARRRIKSTRRGQRIERFARPAPKSPSIVRYRCNSG